MPPRAERFRELDEPREFVGWREVEREAIAYAHRLVRSPAQCAGINLVGECVLCDEARKNDADALDHRYFRQHAIADLVDAVILVTWQKKFRRYRAVICT